MHHVHAYEWVIIMYSVLHHECRMNAWSRMDEQSRNHLLQSSDTLPIIKLMFFVATVLVTNSALHGIFGRR